jgi:hypothetical protein
MPPRGETPLDDIITFGAAAAGNIMRYAMDAMRTAERLAEKITPAGPAATADGRNVPTQQPSGAGRPRLTRGSVLRLPLLVENTGPTPTTELSFAATDVTRVAGEDGESIGADQVTFTPPTLVIGQRDFEKLTVRIRTTNATAPGIYRATVTGGGDWFSTVIEFEVTEPTP